MILADTEQLCDSRSIENFNQITDKKHDQKSNLNLKDYIPTMDPFGEYRKRRKKKKQIHRY